MISKDIFESCVARAALAPTVHNTQPARWTREVEVLSLFCETDVGLTVGDPTGRDAALSCGAVLEAMVLALSAHGMGARVAYTGHDTAPGQGLVAVAHLTLIEADEDRLHAQLENRFTWRGAFEDTPPALYGWTRPDMRLVLTDADRQWVAAQNDAASLAIMGDGPFREELVAWMRLSDRHPRAGLDGMDRGGMQMSAGQARLVPWVLVKLWPVLSAFGLTKRLTAEAGVTSSSPVIALFHRDISESPVVSGRAYLRLCLEAASLGFAGWPMAALSDHGPTQTAVYQHFGLPPDRRLVQAIRFGRPTGAAPSRARRPLGEVLR